MPEEFERVQPGDIITADFMNRILAALEDLDERLTELEGGTTTGGPTITRLVPPGPYRVDDTVTVEGTNFQFTSGLARLFLDGTRITLDDASSDTRLLFVVPALPGLEESGTDFQLRVVTSQGEASVPVTVRPRPPVLFGQVDLEWLGVDPETPQPEAAVLFEFRVTSRASLAAEFTLQPSIGVAVNQSLWNNRLQILNANQSVMTTPRVSLEPLQSRTFFVRITEVPTGTAETPFTLTVTASAGTVTRTLGPLPFTVGEEVEPPDAAITLNPTGSEPAGALVGNTVTATVNQFTAVEFFASFAAAGLYTLSLDMLGSTDLWEISRGGTTPETFDIGEPEIQAGGSATRNLTVRLRPTAASTATGQVEVRLQRAEAPGGRAFILNLIRA